MYKRQEWDLLGIERNENHLQNVYQESEEWNHDFDGFLQGYAMYHIYYGDPDLAFDHEVITVVDEQEEPLSTYWAKIFSEDVLFSPYTPYGDEQYMAAIDAANEAGDIERALTISVMWTSGVQEGQTPLPEIGRSSTPHFIDCLLYTSDAADE